MKRFYQFSILILFILSTVAKSESLQKFADIGNFVLVNGEKISECKIGYRTFGKMNKDKSNIIICPTWFEGTSKGINDLMEKDNFIDTLKFYIIAFDALGDGVSTSPSNYEGNFPDITIRDMVNSQHTMLTNYLGIKHIYGIVGGSMGSMQALEWAVAYPNFMEKVVAYSTTPKMTSYDLLWMNTQLNIIESLKKHGADDKEIKKISGMLTAMVARTPDYVVEHVKIENFDSYLKSFDNEPSKVYTLYDYLSQLKAMMEHDISRDYNGSLTKTAEAIKAKLFIIVSKTDMMVNPTEALKFAKIKRCRRLVLDNNCGHLAPSCELKRIKSEINSFLLGG